MNKESFESDLRKQLDDYEVAAPEGLWQAIEDSLPVAGVTGSWEERPPKPTRGMYWRRWSGRRRWAAAAAVLLIAGGGYMAWRSADVSEDRRRQTVEVMSASHPRTSHPHSPQFSVGEQHDVAVNGPWPSKEKSDAGIEDSSQSVETIHIAQQQMADIPVSEQDGTPPQAPEGDGLASLVRSSATGRNNQQPVSPKRTGETRKAIPRLTASLYAGNVVDGQRMDNRPVIMSGDMAGMGQYGYTLAAGKQMMLGPVYDFEERTEYHQPLRIGLSLGYALAPRWRVLTGVVWQRVQTDLIHNMRNEQLVTENVYHYLGVPLQMSYDVWCKGPFKVYGVVGVEADFNVKAKQRWQTMTQSAKKDRVQWSADAAAGMQYSVVKPFSFFVEAGIRRYFDNGSNVDNIFKDKTVNWNLQLGLRCDLR